MAAQRRAGRLQRQRGLVLEALAKGLELDRVLLRMARYAERLRSGSRCTILALDQTGERVVSIVAPRRQDAAVAATGRRPDALPRRSGERSVGTWVDRTGDFGRAPSCQPKHQTQT